MIDATERLVNLAMLLASSPTPVTAAEIHARAGGYPAGQDEATFLRMFERDKEHLRDVGLVIAVDRSGDVERYHIDAEDTFAGELELTAEDAVLLRTAGAAILEDPSFPFPEDLRVALTKVASVCGTGGGRLARVEMASLMADEEPVVQRYSVAELSRALAARKRVGFTYRKASGAVSERVVEPFGLFAREGRWYLVGRDVDANGMRVFAVVRMNALEVSRTRPKEPDFELAADFDVRDWMSLPFQFGGERAEAILRLTGPAAARAQVLAGAQGTLEPQPDGALLWRVPFADRSALASWIVENGPGIEVLEPPEVVRLLEDGLRKVVSAHGG